MCVFLLLILATTCTPVYADEKIAALILARGGSKGLRLKNLQDVGGVSLLTRTIRIAKLLDLHVTVSTDHPAIALEAIKNGASVFRRSKVTASDWAPSIWGAAEFLNFRREINILVLLQVTSPFLQVKHLQKAIQKIQIYDCIFSVTRSYKLRWRYVDDRVTSLNFKIGARPRRQDWDGELVETGAFYISRRHLIESGYFQNNNCSVIEIPSVESLELDSSYDLELANVLITANLV